MPRTLQYVAEISQVREVTLSGTADLAFWQDQLGGEDLLPGELEGQAQLLISATDARFKGIRFRELSFSVLARQPQELGGQEGYFLVHAFNSVRAFAWVERTFFATPYYFGRLEVNPNPPASIHLNPLDGKEFGVAMGATSAARVPLRSSEEFWRGPIFLPRRGKDREGKLFVARLEGWTQFHPFLPNQDQFTLRPTPAAPVLQWLLDSKFSATDWWLRESARHAKSKTIRRSELSAYNVTTTQKSLRSPP